MDVLGSVAHVGQRLVSIYRRTGADVPFGDADVSVASAGGLLEPGPLNRDVTGVVVRLEDRVLRSTPPALVSSNCGVRE